MCLPNILFPVFMFAFIFHRRSFSPCWPLAISHFLTASFNFHVFLPAQGRQVSAEDIATRSRWYQGR